MTRPILFLDIDGVLNNGRFNAAAQSTTLKPSCVKRLNAVLGETNAAIVLSSAWRYLIINGAMKHRGFEMMLRTHGLACEGRLHTITAPDPELPREFLAKHGCAIRARQVADWLAVYAKSFPDLPPWAVVDDLDLPIEPRERFVRTQRSVGLTNADARKLTKLLLTRP